MANSNIAFLFNVALSHEEAAPEKAKELYHQLLELQPDHAAANINLGTLYYNQRNMAKAELYYRLAIAADSSYALAYFDLGNVLDEANQTKEAIVMYRRALELAPTYADAHYNLALAYDKTQQPHAALKHWRQYIKLDPASGEWANHARLQASRIIKALGITVAATNAVPKRTESRAALFLVTKEAQPALVPKKRTARRAPANQENLFGDGA